MAFYKAILIKTSRKQNKFDIPKTLFWTFMLSFEFSTFVSFWTKLALS